MRVWFVAHRGFWNWTRPFYSALGAGIQLFQPPLRHIEIWVEGVSYEGVINGEHVKCGVDAGAEGVVLTAAIDGVVVHNIPRTYAVGRDTMLQFYEYEVPLDAQELEWFWKCAQTPIKTPYDKWELVFGFTLFKRFSPKSSRGKAKLICSGYTLLATILLQRLTTVMRQLLVRVGDYDKVSPRDLVRSPLLRYSHSRFLKP